LDSPALSRQHAEIYRDGPVFAVRDLGSRNGVFVNGVQVSHGALAPGDVMRLADCVGVVNVSEGDARRAELLELAPQLFGGDLLRDAVEPARLAGPSSLPVVLIGETGTGKERVARAVHHWSGRTGPFYAINCATLQPALAEAELFGHARGAFTGADRAREGRFRAAHQGTVFLDEIADLPLGVQPKLLRFLEDNEVVPLGEQRSLRVDVRIVAASQTPLPALVLRGVFRQDLRARLSGVCVHLPPLRERRCELVALFEKLLSIHSAGAPPALEATFVEGLCLHAWPDNVRELDLLARRLLTFHGSAGTLKRRFLPEDMQLGDASAERVSTRPWYPRRGPHDLRRLVDALRRFDGNVSRAAASLGFSRQRAYRLMAGRTASQLVAQGSDESSSKDA
jgi:two-component system NtrC family response regulator